MERTQKKETVRKLTETMQQKAVLESTGKGKKKGAKQDELLRKERCASTVTLP